MRSSAACRCNTPTEQGATLFPAPHHRRPTLYLASLRLADGRVVTFKSPDAPRGCTTTSQGNLQDTEERQYGKLGETVYEKKTVVTFTNTAHPSEFETHFKFDTFGRLLRLTYPDGEILTNDYDSGGNLKSTIDQWGQTRLIFD